MRFYLSSAALVLSIAILGSAGSLVAAQERSAVSAKVEATAQDLQITQLMAEGDKLFGQKDYQKAIEVYQKALEIAKVGDRISDIANLNNKIGNTYYRLEQYAEAIEFYQVSLSNYQKMGDRPAVAQAWANLGYAYFYAKDYSQAINSYQQALEIAKANNNTSEVANLNNRIGNTYYRLKKYTEAIEFYKISLTNYQKMGDSSVPSYIWSNLGNSYYDSKDYSQAINSYEKALEIEKRSNNTVEVAKFHNKIGNTYYAAENYDKAVLSYQNSLTIYQELGDRPAAVAQVSSNLGDSYYYLKNYPQALQSYQQALDIYQKLGNHLAQVAQILSDIGRTYNKQNQYSKSIETYQQSLKIYQQLGNLKKVAHQWRSIGYLYLDQSDLVLKESGNYSQAVKISKEALEAFQKTLLISRQLPDRKLEMDSLVSIGQAKTHTAIIISRSGNESESLDLKKQSLQPFQEALSIAQEIQDTPKSRNITGQVFQVYHAIVNSLNYLKKYESSPAYITRMKEIIDETDDPDNKQDLLKLEYNIYFGFINRYNNPEQYDQYLEYLQKAIDVAGKLEKPGQEVGHLISIATVYRFRGQYSQALMFYERALSRSHQVHNVRHDFFALVGIGLTYGAQANYTESLIFYEKALELSRSNQWSDKEQIALNNMANIYLRQGLYEKSLSIYKKSLITHQKSYEIFNQGVTSESIRSECQKGILNSEDFSGVCKTPDKLPIGSNFNDFKSMILDSRNTSRSMVGTALNNIGSVYAEQGDYPKSLEFRQKALEIAYEINDLTSVSTYLNNIAMLYSGQGEYTKAFEFLQKALKVSIDQKYSSAEIVYRSNLGVIYSSLGRYPESLDDLQKALKITEKLGEPSRQAIILISIGNVYGYQGDYAKALNNLQQAQTIYQKIGEPVGMLKSLTATGDIYRKLGQFTQALDAHQQALTIAQKIGARPEVVEVLAQLASTYQAQSKFDQALERYQEGLTIAQTIGDLEQEAKLLSGMGSLYLQQSQPAKALNSLQKALTIQQRIGVRRDAAETLSLIGQLQIQSNQFAEAQSGLQRSIALFQEIGDRPTEAQAYGNLAALFNKQNQPEIAIVFYKKSVSLYEDIRKGLAPLPKDQQQSYTNTVAQTYRDLADLLLKNDRILEARQVIELLKLQELEDYNKNTRGQTAPLAFRAAETEFLDKLNQEIKKQYKTLNEVQTDLAQLANKPIAEKTPEIRDRIDRLRQIETDIRKNVIKWIDRPDIQAMIQLLKQDDKILPLSGDNITQLQGKLSTLKKSNQNAAILFPMVFNDRIELLLITSNSILRRTVSQSTNQQPFNRESFNQLISNFIGNLKTPNTDPKPNAYELYKHLIKPLETDLKNANINTIIYGPDRRLRSISLSALHDGKQWLIERYQISHINSVSTTNFTDERESAPKVLAGSISDNLTTEYIVEIPATPKSVPFNGLPGVKLEIKVPKKLFPNSTLLEETSFSTDEILDTASNYNILHFATHGYFQLGKPEQSFILFGGPNRQGKNYATVKDLEDWNIPNIDLVVLSACQTAVVADQNDDKLGIMGLGDQFQRRGARSAIASLWNVNDTSTALLMKFFYTHLAQNKPKSEALRLAQLDLLNIKDRGAQNQAIDNLSRFVNMTITTTQATTAPKSPIAQGYSHPYYWAPFILIGNGR